MFLFIAALLFTAGNMTAACLCGNNIHGHWAPALVAAAATALTAILLPFCIKFSRLTFLLFPLLGASGFLCVETMRPDVRSSLLRDSRSMDIHGIIIDGGLSSSGRPFLELSLGNENTIIYNIPDTVCWMPGDSVHATVRCARVRNFSEDFDYRGYMEDRGIFYTCFCGKNSTVKVLTSKSCPLRALPARLRWRFSAAVDAALPSDGMAQTRAVVKALAPSAGPVGDASGTALRTSAQTACFYGKLPGGQARPLDNHHSGLMGLHYFHRLRRIDTQSGCHVQHLRGRSAGRQTA